MLVGVGNIGSRHAAEINRIGELVAWVDIDPHATVRVPSLAQVPYFDSLDAFFSSSILADLAVIATPNYLHATQSVQALRHGLHVLCEKPMALTGADARLMWHEAQVAQRQLMVVKQNRFNPPVQWLKQQLDAGKLGTITNVQMNCFWQRPSAYYANSWRGKKALDGGTLFTQFSHFVDLLVWLFGPLQLHDASLENLQHQQIIETEDTGIIRWKQVNGDAVISMHYSVNAYHRNLEGALTVLGTMGTVKIGGAYLNRLEYSELKGEEAPVIASRDEPNNYGFYQGSMSNHHLVYDQVVQALTENAEFMVSAQEAIETIDTIEAVYNMATSRITSSTIYDIRHGIDFTCVQPVNLYGCRFGDSCFVGPFVEIQRGVEIGHRVRIQSHSFLCEGVRVGNDCFIGHGVMFINDTFSSGGPAKGDRSQWRQTEIGNQVSIGSNATILPVRIVDQVVIGAGSVVTTDILEPGTYVGNPARKLRGEVLEPGK